MASFWVIKGECDDYLTGSPSDRQTWWTVRIENAFFFTSKADADRYRFMNWPNYSVTLEVEVSITVKE